MVSRSMVDLGISLCVVMVYGLTVYFSDIGSSLYLLGGLLSGYIRWFNISLLLCWLVGPCYCNKSIMCI